jgi:hypothetical protein
MMLRNKPVVSERISKFAFAKTVKTKMMGVDIPLKAGRYQPTTPTANAIPAPITAIRGTGEETTEV